MRKILKGLGIIGALMAVEATIRLSNLAGAFGGGDAGIYFFITLVAVAAAGVLLLSFAKPTKRWLRWTVLGLSVLSMAFLMLAPAFGAVGQAITGLVLVIVGALAIEKHSGEPKDA